MTLDRAEFAQQIASLFLHLYDGVYLRTHPLAQVFIPDRSIDRRERARMMHHLLRDAIEDLRPLAPEPAMSREWRRYRLMVRRHIDGLDLRAVAKELGISRRQFYREHDEAIGVVAELLWQRYCLDAQSETAPADTATLPSSDRLETLRQEVGRVAGGDSRVSVEQVLQGACDLLESALQQRASSVVLSLEGPLPQVVTNAGLLRQVVLGMLWCLVESSAPTAIRLSARVESRDLVITATAARAAAQRPAAPLPLKDRLSALAEVAALSGGQVLPLNDPSKLGIALRLRLGEAPTVLVVDDNEEVIELYKRYLSLRYNVVTASGAGEALDLLTELRPHAITLDLMMPDQDGWALLQRLANDPGSRQIPIIVCSVLRQRELALALGAFAFLEKPVTQQALLSALEAVGEDNK